MPQLYALFWYFFLYAFLGWCAEVAFAACKTGRLVNRGFLNGPVCPIYGFGMLAAVTALGPVRGSLPALFFGGGLLATALELVGGWALMTLFHARWWDYSDKPFNLGGYICLRFSLLWGLGVTAVMRLVDPAVENGWYRLIDRHADAADPADESAILGRGSLNFTLALYDADRNELYYLTLDT